MRRKELSDFGKLVSSRLIEINMTQKRLAQIIGTTEVYLSQILHGKRSGEKYKIAIIKTLSLQLGDEIKSK